MTSLKFFDSLTGNSPNTHLSTYRAYFEAVKGIDCHKMARANLKKQNCEGALSAEHLSGSGCTRRHCRDGDVHGRRPS